MGPWKFQSSFAFYMLQSGIMGPIMGPLLRGLLSRDLLLCPISNLRSHRILVMFAPLERGDLGLSNGDSAAERRTFDSLTVKSQLFFLADRWVGVFLRRSIKSVFESTGVDDGLLNGPSFEKRLDVPV